MGESSDGSMTVRAYEVVATAEREAEPEYRACVEKSLPFVETLEPITGYGDLSGTAWAKVDWAEFARLQAECARNQGFEVRIASDDLVEPVGPFHLFEVTEAVLDACGDGLNLPPLS